jgi:hypothetical protein
MFLVALTRFKRTLYWSRLFVRELTYTLHLPPAHAEIYGGPHSEWLRDCLERLPRLQSLIVNGLPFFDHASLVTLRHSSLWWRSNRPHAFPVFSLRLLDASGCTNATSTGLSEALSHLPDLVSLDLSRTPAAKDETLFTKLQYLPSLRVLKLKGLGLKDADLSIITSSVKTRLRSLDVSQNHLTDNSARLLLEHCLKDTSYESHATRASVAPIDRIRPLGEIDIFGTEDLDDHLRKKLTQGFVGSLAIEEARDVGITHLYLSQNAMTVEGISGLLRSRRLQVLDIGTLPMTLQTPTHPSYDGLSENLAIPGVEKLTPTLAKYASDRLVYLRMNYAVVTKDAPLEALPSPRAELSGNPSLYAPAGFHELEVIEQPLPELESWENAVYELPGDIVQPTELPGSSGKTKHAHASQGSDLLSQGESEVAPTPTIEVTPEPSEIKRGPAYAPEVVPEQPPISPISPIADASGGLSTMMSSIVDRARISPISSDARPATMRSRHNSTYHTEDLKARLNLRQSQENRLHPGMLPKVRTLILTDVPTSTSDYEIIDRIIQFIKDCASEAEIARLRAKHTYMLPPGRCRKVAEREYAWSIFALRRIVLEMAPVDITPKKISTSWRQYPTKSSTEDTDSEAFWEAATYDFSFFGDEECGLPSAEPGRHMPLAAMSGLQWDSGSKPALPPRRAQPEINTEPDFDVVAEIAKFRKDRKAANAVVRQFGEAETFVEGYWPGDITVVRKSAEEDVGSLDYYGNRFEGWLYR